MLRAARTDFRTVAAAALNRPVQVARDKRVRGVLCERDCLLLLAVCPRYLEHAAVLVDIGREVEEFADGQGLPIRTDDGYD